VTIGDQQGKSWNSDCSPEGAESRVETDKNNKLISVNDLVRVT